MTTPVSSLFSMQPQSTPRNAAAAAQQFEALLIHQMLSSVRQEAADDDSDGDQTGSPMLDVADQQFSQLLAANGGLGLAHVVANGLKKES